MKPLIDKKYIPLDKSWIIRMGVLDILNGKNDIVEFLARQKNLGDDLLALYNASLAWNSDKPINVGESGTLYRFLKFASWKFGLNKKFILRGTLKRRKICDNSRIVNYPLSRLLKLDNNTSQWASASILIGSNETIKNSPHKLKLTYTAIAHWKKQQAKNKRWTPRYDKTILKQASVFLDLLRGKKAKFIPKQSEDYCFARAFGFMTKEEGGLKWPSLMGHESNRLEEMEKSLQDTELGKLIKSKDHRVAQAIAMKQKVDGKSAQIKYPKSVNKSWPQFWKFLRNADSF